MKVHIEISSDAMKELIVKHLIEKLGAVHVDIKNVVIETRSKQNYKSEWEQAEYRAVYEATVK